MKLAILKDVKSCRLRESARHEMVARALLEAPYFWRFFTAISSVCQLYLHCL